MAALEPKIYALLSGTSGIASVVSTRIYPVILPQGCTLPAITYQRISGGQVSSLGGFSGLENPRIQIDVMASTYAAAKSLAALIYTAMEGASTFDALLISDQDLYEDVAECYRVSMDFSVWHKP